MVCLKYLEPAVPVQFLRLCETGRERCFIRQVPACNENQRSFRSQQTRGRADEVLPKRCIRCSACVERRIHHHPIQAACNTPFRGVGPMKTDPVVHYVLLGTGQSTPVRLDQIDMGNTRHIQKVPRQVTPSPAKIRTTPLERLWQGLDQRL